MQDGSASRLSGPGGRPWDHDHSFHVHGVEVIRFEGGGPEPVLF